MNKRGLALAAALVLPAAASAQPVPADLTVLPAVPSFYTRPQTVEEVVDTVVARVLQNLGVAQNLQPAIEIACVVVGQRQSRSEKLLSFKVLAPCRPADTSFGIPVV